MLSLSSLAAALAAGSLLPAVSAWSCPPLGPVLDAPLSPSKNDAVKQAIEVLKAQIDETFGTPGGASAVSIGVKSIHEKQSLFDYHFNPSVKSDVSTDTIDENTIYRVGSVSKFVPALLALQLDLDLDASVLKFLPEFGKNSDDDEVASIQWKDITVRSLMSQISGLPTQTTNDLTLMQGIPWSLLGFPNPAELKCSGPPAKPCEVPELIEALENRSPSRTPFSTPLYSNVGFGILSLVLEAATGEKFADLAQKHIFDVVGMDRTSFSGPAEAFKNDLFVAVTEGTWNTTLGIEEASGGMFSSTKDMLAFMEAIVSNKLLSPVKTRQWMKPQSHTASLSKSIGSPWEILRSDGITSDKRVVDVYTKLGSLGLYNSLVGIIPDYDIVFSVIVAGPEVTMERFAQTKLTSAVIRGLVPAVEAAGKAEASKSVLGTYVDKTTNSTLVLEIDDGPGILVKTFRVRGGDPLHVAATIILQGGAVGGIPVSAPPEIRLYPTGRTNSETGSTEAAWRVVFDTTPEDKVKDLEDNIFYKSGTCESWTAYDAFTYNAFSIGEFVLTSDADGVTRQISSPAFNLTLTKVCSGSDISSGNI